MSKKRFWAILAAACMALGLTGCQNNVNAEQTSAPVNTEAVEVKNAEPPTDGWTVEELANVFYIGGKNIEVPFIVSDLESNYTIKEDVTQILDGGACGTILYYNDTELLVLNYTDIDNFEQLSSKNADAVSVNFHDKDFEFYNSIAVFNGIYLGSSQEEVETAFGKADLKSDNSLSYFNKNTDDVILGFLFDNNELYGYSIILN